MLGRLLDGAISQGGQLLESAKEVTAEKALYSVGFLYLVMLLGERGNSYYRSYVHPPLFTGEEVAHLSHELSRVNILFDQAMLELSQGSLGAALHGMNLALSSFKSAVSKNAALASSFDDKRLSANMLEKRAEIYCLLGNYERAEKDLLTAFKTGRAKTSAYNLMAHLCIHHMQAPQEAKKYLEESLKQNDEQLFARYYLSKSDGTLDDREQLALNLLDIYHREHIAHQAAQAAGQEPKATEAWNRLHHTLPELCVPYLLMNWLELKLEHVLDTHDLLSTADALKGLLLEHPNKFPLLLQVKLKEARIKALFRIGKLREDDPVFSNSDDILRVYVSSYKEVGRISQYYLRYDGKHIDNTVSTLFKRGIQTDYLEKYPEQLAIIIEGWARNGWLVNDNNQCMRDICQKLQQLQDDPYNSDIKKQLRELCSHPETIKLFVDVYVKNNGWSPWLRVVSLDTQAGLVRQSLLEIACHEQQVNLKVVDWKTPSLINKSELDLSRDDWPLLTVSYNENLGSFQMMQPLSTPSTLYNWMALTECWDLLKNDPCNKTMLKILGSRGYATLPQMALARLTDARFTSEAKEAFIVALEEYLKHCQGSDEEKESVTNILQNYRNANQAKASNRLFSTTALCMGLAAAAGVAYCLRK